MIIPLDSKVLVGTMKEGYRLAPFGTKSFDPSNNTPDTYHANSSASVVSGESDSKLTAVPIGGDLIDVQDSQGFWYQVT